MRAALVSVGYDDILAITLPYNIHHFEEVLVVTTPDSADGKIAEANGAKVHYTNAFYDQGAHFNKWKGFEEGLDAFGRHGWMCIMDADIMWPKWAPSLDCLAIGNLYSVYRRLWLDVTEPNPPESFWSRLPLFQDYEFAGYTQIFHASDPHLPKAPWHQLDWKHAGGADSFFQQMWPAYNKCRLPWEVLHLGPPGRNWMGRATPRVDGTEVPQAAKRREALGQMFLERHRNQRTGNPYQAERLRPPHSLSAIAQQHPASK